MTATLQGPEVRPPGLPVRRNRIRRASAILTPVRAGAVLVMVLATMGIYGVGASSAFVYRRLDFDASQARYTTEDVVRTALGLDAAPPNLFLMKTDTYQRRLLELPAVIGAEVTASLPDMVRVRLVERVPLIVWSLGGRRFLVDRTGTLFAPVESDRQTAGLPLVADLRGASTSLDVGGQVDPVDLDAATRLAGVSPADIGSAASSLRLSIEDGDGFVVHPVGVPWVAAFGVYTATLRSPAIIPGQVRLLHSLLAGRETGVKRVVLADDRTGTFEAR
jgi:cell division septal protein FtsQ